MPEIDKLSWEILNALADDAENIEQVYLAVAFEFGDDQSYRRIVPSIALEEIADRLTALFGAGYLTVTVDGNEHAGKDFCVHDLCSGWFRMTPTGRAVWQGMTPAPVGRNQ